MWPFYHLVRLVEQSVEILHHSQRHEHAKIVPINRPRSYLKTYELGWHDSVIDAHGRVRIVVGNDVDTLTTTIQFDKNFTEPTAGKTLCALSKDKARSNTLGFDDLFHFHIAPVA